MSTVTIKEISELQKETHRIRNICILAHIDHGKTTLSDSLIATNGIISSRLAGKIRYLDSRQDEQERGITMKSSAISLLYDKHLINLIDSPGHVDFSSEVATSLRLCDGALVLIDAVEGICTQTHEVLRQAYLEHVKPCLVINKIDRLILELKIAPIEAYQQLKNIIEQANAIMATLVRGNAYSMLVEDQEVEKSESFDSTIIKEEEDDECYFSPTRGNVVFASAFDGWAFSVPLFAKLYAEKLGMKETVLAQTLWGEHFFDPKNKRVVTNKSLAMENRWKPMFVQFVLENIYRVYDVTMCAPTTDRSQLEKIIKTLNVKVLLRDLASKDTRSLLQKILSQWIPLAREVLHMVVDHLPSPLEAQSIRIPYILRHLDDHSLFETEEAIRIRHDIAKCSSAEDVSTVVYISKMVAVPMESLPGHHPKRTTYYTAEELKERYRLAKERLLMTQQQKTEPTQPSNLSLEAINMIISNPKDEMIPLYSNVSIYSSQDTSTTQDEEKMISTQVTATQIASYKQESTDVFIAFARIFSGCLKTGQKLYVLKPKYDPRLAETCDDWAEITVGPLYLWMGRQVEILDEVPTGNLVGIGGLDQVLYKSGTLSSSMMGPLFKHLYFQGAPILRVAVEPVDPLHIGRLLDGLKLLNQSDPVVEILRQENGEHVIIAAGELHLERCIQDLCERFAKVPIHVSSPLVSFREGIVLCSEDDTIETVTLERTTTAHDDLCSISVYAQPLPWEIVEFIEKHPMMIRRLNEHRESSSSSSEGRHETITPIITSMSSSSSSPPGEFSEEERRFLSDLKILFGKAGSPWVENFNNIWSFGPRRTGSNLLFNTIPGYDHGRLFESRSVIAYDDSNSNSSNSSHSPEGDDNIPFFKGSIKDYEANIVAGFQLATHAGPLCEEPMMGVAFFVKKMTLKASETSYKETQFQKLPGQIIYRMKEACREAFMKHSPRLILSMYSCIVRATPDVLGKVYTVLSKRRGRIVSEEMKEEDTSYFQIEARLPIIESFGFADDIRKRTSGSAHPQLLFAGWEVLDEDPFWVPKTKEELEELGDKADRANLALKYMNMVRKRKGLKTDEKLIEHAEKQRTLMKK
jgi:ribosome assembly protein 1